MQRESSGTTRFEPATGDPRELLTGVVERVTFRNDENGFTVLRVQARGRRELVTVVGHAAAIAPGELVHASGIWTNDRLHGPQFKAAHLHATAPTSVDAIEKYLASGLLKGVGPHFARRLVTAFGVDVFDVIEQSPERLYEVPGIGRVRADRIRAGWSDQRAIREIMIFLHAHGVGSSRAVRIHRTYGADAIALISDNPYRLARDIRGIGFVTADMIAGKLGVDKTSLMRARAGVSYALATALDEGHCGLPRDELIALTARLLDIPPARIEEALTLELTAGEVIADEVAQRVCIFLAWLHRAERSVADRLRTLAAAPAIRPTIAVDKALTWVEQRQRLALADRQRDAVRLALTTKVLVVTGGPGVGKTTILRAILEILRAKGMRAALCAPTGRAAKRLSETTGMEARTIHRLLEVNPRDGGFRRSRANPLDCDLLVVDEMSMVDVPLFNALLLAAPDAASLLLVGDVDQLPPVGPGQPLADIIASNTLPVVRLTEVFRQAAQSQIVQAAHRINSGEMPEFPSAETASDLFFVDAVDPEDAVRKLVHVVKERIPQRFGLDPIRDVQVLCPMQRGSLGARALNAALQSALNTLSEPRIDRFGWTFTVGDKVMQTENDYDKDVYNGDLGVVSSIDVDASELTIEFDGRQVVYDFGELDRVALAYAATIHKSQGSEYPAVVIPVATQHYVMLQRNLLYTGVTRGRRLVVLVGQRKALAIAVRGRQTIARWTKLRERLA